MTSPPRASNEVKTVCCVCGVHVRGPETSTALVSHGFCKTHGEEALAAARAAAEAEKNR